MSFNLGDYRDLFRGERAFVLGNGPSLKLFDLSLLDTELTFGSNLIYLSGWQPRFWALEDRLVAEDRAGEITARLTALPFLPERIKKHFTDDWAAIWLKSNTCRYKPGTKIPYWLRGDTFSDGFTVTYLLLQLAFWMGIKTVYLLGVDHDFTGLPESVVLDGAGTILKSNGEDNAHFTTEYFGAGKRYHDPNPGRMERAYNRALIEYNLEGRSVYNCTPGTKLKVFPLRRWESVI